MYLYRYYNKIINQIPLPPYKVIFVDENIWGRPKGRPIFIFYFSGFLQ